ncbi:MAG TPA: diaminopimelate decarboxylase [Trebonia sp.]
MTSPCPDLDPLIWPRTVTRDDRGMLHVAGVSAHTLAGQFGTPMYVFDERDFRARCRDFVGAFADADVYYAGKAFLTKAITRIVREEGLRLDVCSGGELAVALAGGMPPGRIGLHGNNKSVRELRTAVDVGVGRIIIDSFTELDRLTRLAEVKGRRPKVLLRVTVGIDAHTHEYTATAHHDQKFGFSLDGGDALAAVERVLAAGSLELTGLHSHIGSQIFGMSGFEVAARRLIGTYRSIRDLHAIVLPELNLGGGFGIAYTPADDPASVSELALGIAKILEEECNTWSLPVPRLAIEPGRAIVGPSTFTLYEVGTVKETAARRYLSVDGGMSDNIRPALYGAAYTAVLANRWPVGPEVLSRVVGKHCETGDVVVWDISLPADIGPGDLLAVPATGAYCRAMASNYNLQPRPPVIAVADGTARVMTRRETFADLMALEEWV